jgi:hypothetical protein
VTVRKSLPSKTIWVAAGEIAVAFIDTPLWIIAEPLLHLRWVLATHLLGLPDHKCSIQDSDEASNDTVDNDTPFRYIIATNRAREHEAKSAIDHAQDDDASAKPAVRDAEDGVILAFPSEQQMLPQSQRRLH